MRPSKLRSWGMAGSAMSRSCSGWIPERLLRDVVISTWPMIPPQIVFVKKGGRPRILEATPQVEAAFVLVIAEHTAGCPQHGVKWTNQRQQSIADSIEEQLEVSISRRIVGQLLKKHGFVRRKALKKKSFKQSPDRNTQFEHIVKLKESYLKAGQIVLSIDTKKKELLGNFYRDGRLYTQETIEVLDHDFPSYSDGKVIPHGLYDIGLNKAHINLGTSHDTTEFACDSVVHWWREHDRADHPEATQLLLLCDGGGSNPANSWLFKQDLQRLAYETGLEIRVAYYPPYCSKHNPIEHWVFPHLTRACEGVVFTSVPLVQRLMEKNQTRTGLSVTVDILSGVYETGRKALEHLKSTLNVVSHSLLPKLNYTISPQT